MSRPNASNACALTGFIFFILVMNFNMALFKTTSHSQRNKGSLNPICQTHKCIVLNSGCRMVANSRKDVISCRHPPFIVSWSNTIAYTDLDPKTTKMSLNVSLRSQRNRLNKAIELFRRVKKRRLENGNRMLDIRIANFRNDKCNLQLLSLPVSPVVNMANIVPFKTVPEMRSQVPFNPAPILKSVGFRFKPRDKESKYERFNEHYPMDRIMELLDARSCGYYSRMETPFKITGESDEMATPMCGKPVSPGGGVGRGAGFGGSKKPERKKKPLPIEMIKSVIGPRQDAKTPDSIDEYNVTRDEAKKKLEGWDEKAKEYWGVLNHALPKGSNVKLPFLDDACREGDIFSNPRYLGEYRYKYWIHPFAGNSTLPGEVLDVIEEYNKKKPQKAIDIKHFDNDIIYCHSNGTIVHLAENAPPYSRANDTFKLPGEDPREPRFVILANVGFVKQYKLEVGQDFPPVTQDIRQKAFDNYYFYPKSTRHPVYLPDGRVAP